MSRYSRENPDHPELTVDEIEERAAVRREMHRNLAAAGEESPEKIRSDRLNAAAADERRAEIESGSEWPEGDDEDE